MRRGAFLCSLGAFTAAPALAEVALTPLVIAPPSGTEIGAVYYALQAGWFQQAGLDVSVTAASGAAAIPGVVGGAIQIAYANVFSLCEAHQKGLPVTLIAPGIAYVTATPFIQLLVAGDSPARAAKDLVGKIIGLSALDDLSAIAIRGWLNEGGVDVASVKFIELKASAMPDALLQKRVDAIAVYEPYLSAATSKGARMLAKPYDSIAPTFFDAVWFTTTSYAAEHRDVIAKIVPVLNRLSQFYDAHYDTLVPIIVQYSKLPLEVVQRLKPEPIPTTLNPALLQPVIDAAAKYHAIPSSFPAKDFIFT